MSYTAWPDYVSVAERKLQAEKKLAQLRKKGRRVEPVILAGRTIAASFWGKSWCQNLERYSDYETRLPRGRSYVRNNLVLDLKIASGKVSALVNGSQLYTVTIGIAPMVRQRWKSVCRDCTGNIDSLVELLGGRLAQSVMDRVCREGDGLFPAPAEIKLSCSCPDWADMCKHVAAALYGIGARLDEKPELLFVLRGVDAKDLLVAAGENAALPRKAPGAGKILDESDIADVFGIEMAAAPVATAPMKEKTPPLPKPAPRSCVIGKRMSSAKKQTASKKNKKKQRVRPRATTPRNRSAQPVVSR
ncbi:MAG TPA: SWIM zinc finger family protein [Rhizomicrobium sp.]|nr:SWIM zinc finger family protein [Rhizomicrobium sp.]